MPSATSHRRRNTDLTRANEVRLRRAAEYAASDDAKRAKAVRTVQAAIRLGYINVSEVIPDDLDGVEAN